MPDNLRPRLARNAKANVTYSPVARWDPSVYSDDPHIRRIEVLNKEAFRHTIFAFVDDILLKCFFASKTESGRWAAVHPEIASSAKSKLNALAVIDNDTAAILSKRCHALTHPGANDDLALTVETCAAVYLQHAIFGERGADWEAPLKQYGAIFRSGSLVTVCKVQFRGPTGLGLVARDNIPPATYIVETGSSMSADLVRPPGPSIIRSRPDQLGPEGNRSILGPFRLVNHDCNPNAQICPLKRTHAFIMISLREIRQGEEITVKYERDGYYGESCLCSTCQGRSTRKLQRPADEQPHSTSEKRQDTGKKRKRQGHRGGKNGRGKRAKRSGQKVTEIEEETLNEDSDGEDQ